MDSKSYTEKLTRAVTVKRGMDLSGLNRMFPHVNTVAAATAYVSISQNVRSARVVSGMMDRMVKDDRSARTPPRLPYGPAAPRPRTHTSRSSRPSSRTLYS